MGFFLFLLVTITLLIRPSEQFPDLETVPIYEMLIILCLAFSFTGIIQQFTLQSLETQPVTVCVVGLFVAVILSHLSQGSPPAAIQSGYEFIKVLVYFLLLVANLTTVLRLRIFVGCLGLLAVAFVTVAVLHYHEFIELPEPKIPQVLLDKGVDKERMKGAFLKDFVYDSETGQAIEYRRLRGTGIYGDPNDFSLLLTTGLFIALWCISDPKQGIVRLAWLPALILFGYALWLTQSRGGMLGLLAGFLALVYGRFGMRGLIMLGMPLVPLGLVLFGGRMASISTSDGTGQLRIQIWSMCISAMMSSPVFGIGMHGLVSMTGWVAHNSFVGAFAELGLFGGTLFFGTFFFALIGMQKLLNNRQGIVDLDLRRILPFLLAVLVSYAVGILSLSRTASVPTYLVLGLVVVSVNLAALRAPALVQRIDGWLVQRLALASVAFFAMTYVFVRVLKV